MRRTVVIVAALIIGILALMYYFSLNTPSDIATKGNGDNTTVQWLALAVSVVSLVTSLVGLLQKVLELRVERKKS